MQTTIVVENLTARFYPWDEELGQCPTNVSNFKVHMRSSKIFFTRLQSLLICTVFMPFLRSQIFFPRLQGCSHYSFRSSYFPPWPVFLIYSFVQFRVLKLQLSLQSVHLNVHITPILGQPHWLPADARISCGCVPLFQRRYLFHSSLSL